QKSGQKVCADSDDKDSHCRDECFHDRRSDACPSQGTLESCDNECQKRADRSRFSSCEYASEKPAEYSDNQENHGPRVYHRGECLMPCEGLPGARRERRIKEHL